MMRYRTSRLTVTALIVAATAIASSATAATIYSANSATTVMHGGDRELLSLSFTGSPTVITGEDFLRYDNGELYWGGGTPSHFGWNDVVPRDMNTSGNTYAFNPDRADAASAYASEAAATGTLASVFGPFNGYKNMSLLLDGEDASYAYHVDLFFAGAFRLSGDTLNDTIEVALLERGSNSDMNLYGILPGGALTAPLKITRNGSRAALWQLDTLEIAGTQSVAGIGVSIDASWQDLIGLRVESGGASFGGPDLIGIAAVPEPTTLAFGLLAVATLGRRRR